MTIMMSFSIKVEMSRSNKKIKVRIVQNFILIWSMFEVLNKSVVFH